MGSLESARAQEDQGKVPFIVLVTVIGYGKVVRASEPSESGVLLPSPLGNKAPDQNHDKSKPEDIPVE